ncbi:hypothetical protein DRQ53_13670 [bacterium]|nr:MAG: hypothetical protein DRQ53_13670 [bacterium]
MEDSQALEVVDAQILEIDTLAAEAAIAEIDAAPAAAGEEPAVTSNVEVATGILAQKLANHRSAGAPADCSEQDATIVELEQQVTHLEAQLETNAPWVRSAQHFAKWNTQILALWQGMVAEDQAQKAAAYERAVAQQEAQAQVAAGVTDQAPAARG